MKLKKIVFLFILVIFSISIIYYSFITIKTRYVINDYFNQGRWEELKENHRKLSVSNHGKCSILLFGDSMTERFDTAASDSIINLGISGDFTEGLLKRI